MAVVKVVTYEVKYWVGGGACVCFGPAPPSAATYKEQTASPLPKSNRLLLSLVSLDESPLVISLAGRSPFSKQFIVGREAGGVDKCHTHR